MYLLGLVAFAVMWVGYVYVAYPLIVLALSRCMVASRTPDCNYRPRVALVVSAFNEAAVIGQKLDNALNQTYPPDCLTVVVSSDGSTDKTNEIVAEYARGSDRVVLCAYEKNRGKSAALMDTLDRLDDVTDVVVFSDSNAMYDSCAVANLARWFVDPRVGAVAGCLEYTNGASEGRYRRYENLIKLAEGRLGACTSAEGSIFAARRSLIPRINPTHVEDLTIPLTIALGGHTVLYEPFARSLETFDLNRKAQFKRRCRIVNRAVRSAWSLRRELNPFRGGRVAWMFLSHRVGRWLAPLPILAGAVGSVALLVEVFGAWQVVFVATGAFAAGALARILVPGTRTLLDLPVAFCLANLAVLIGAASAIAGMKAVRWQPERGT